MQILDACYSPCLRLFGRMLPTQVVRGYALRGGCMHVRVHCMVQVAVSILDWPSGSGVEVTLQICSFLNPTLVLVHLHAAVW